MQLVMIGVHAFSGTPAACAVPAHLSRSEHQLCQLSRVEPTGRKSATSANCVCVWAHVEFDYVRTLYVDRYTVVTQCPYFVPMYTSFPVSTAGAKFSSISYYFLSVNFDHP